MCKDDCRFSLWSPNDNGGFVEDRAFSCFAQAQEGDFTVGKGKLDQTAEVLAYNWVYLRVNPNDMITVRYTCQKFGLKYDDLFDEEVDYLERKTKEEISKYGAT